MPAFETPISDAHAQPTLDIGKISISDVVEALAKGAADYWRHPSHYMFLVIIYPAVGILLAVWSAGGDTFALLYPMAAGFALLGPVAAIGLYELSRRREAGLDDSPRHALGITRHPALGAMVAIGVMLAVIFAAWIASAAALYSAFMGASPPQGALELLTMAFTTPQGMALLFWGNLVGFGFALLVLATTAIAFPLLVDKGGSAGHALATSLRAFRTNPVPILAWGLMVAVIVFVASLPLFVGLALALPILGHATWHLYRKMVA